SKTPPGSPPQQTAQTHAAKPKVIASAYSLSAAPVGGPVRAVECDQLRREYSYPTSQEGRPACRLPSACPDRSPARKAPWNSAPTFRPVAESGGSELGFVFLVLHL